MSSPGGGVPPGGVSGSGGMGAHSRTTEGQWRTSIYNQVNYGFGGVGAFGLLMRVFTAGFDNVLEAIFGTVDDTYVRDLPTITDHTNQITEIQAIIDTLTLHGNTKVFTSNQTWNPSPGLVSALAIVIGAGGGGGAGRWDLVPGNRRGGGGGQGAGEYHTLPEIPAALLPKDGSGNFLPVSIGVGEGGAGGNASGGSGIGGGSSNLGTWLTAQGGDGGSGDGVGGFTGGGGMVPGGRGGDGANRGGNSAHATAAGSSVTGYGLYGGGGGGGGGGVDFAGSGQLAATAGGVGGAGLGGAVNQPGTAPSALLPTGGGGGGGSTSASTTAGAGAIAGGGGGGYGGGLNAWSRGGKGGNGIVFIVEKFV